MVGIAEYGLMAFSAVLGIGIGWLLAKNRYAGDVVRAEAQVTEITIRAEAQTAAISQSKELMLSEMKSVATNAARQNSEDFLRLAEERLGKVESEAVKDYDARKKEVESLVSPIKEHLEKLEKATSEMELKREGAYHGLKRTAELLHQQTVDLRDTNIQLSTALRGSVKARGNWGEVALKNIAEAAGMLKHCDFDIEATLKSGVGGARVDLLAKIPNGGSIPVDSKVPLAAYWDGLELTDNDARGLKMEEHAKAVKAHINTLAKRDYPSLIDGVDFTVMFIPAEPILSTAFEYDPTLQEYAFSKHVLIVTPVTLIALLRTVGLYWQQHSMAENAKEIHSKAREFYDHVSKFSHDLAKMGRGINTVVSAYNDAVGSYDGRVIPSGRRLEELDVTEGAQRKLADLPPAATARTVKQLAAATEEE